MMDEHEGLVLVGQVFGSDKEIDVKLPMRELWLIVSALQLQITHPGLHEPLQTICEGIGRRLGALIVEELPQIGELLEMGWHREDDVEQDDVEQDDVDDFDPDAYGNKDIADDLGDVDDHNDASDIPW